MAYKKVVIKVSTKVDGKRFSKFTKALAEVSERALPLVPFDFSIQGANRDLIVLTGPGLDAAVITMKLRKKFDKSAEIESVATIEPPKEKEEKKEEKKEVKKEEKKEDAPKPFDAAAQYPQYHPHFVEHFSQPNFLPGGYNHPMPAYNVPYNQPPPPPPAYDAYPDQPQDPCCIM